MSAPAPDAAPAADWIWARVRNWRTDKPAGRSAHLVDTNSPGTTLCGVGKSGERVSPDATLASLHQCSRCKTVLTFHPQIEVRTTAG
jgi:hypothetical protein